MNIIKKPDTTEFTSTFQEFVIDSDRTVNFKIKKNGILMLNEDYVPDRYRKIVTRGIGQFLALSLWGAFPSGNTTPQDSQNATFEFYIDDVLQQTTKVYLSNYRVFPKGGLFNITQVKVSHVDALEYINVNQSFQISSQGKSYTIDVTELSTIDISPARAKELLSLEQLTEYTCTIGDVSYQVYLKDAPLYTLFRFKNWLDLPETAVAFGELRMTAEGKNDTGVMFGIERKFAENTTDTYTIQSGPLHHSDEYKVWQSLLNSREVEIFSNGKWYPISITKRKLDKFFNVTKLNGVEFSFKFANPIDNNIL